jgi:hypothetical protein
VRFRQKVRVFHAFSADPVRRIAHHNQDQFKSPAKAGLFKTKQAAAGCTASPRGPLASPISKSASESLWGSFEQGSA